MAQGLEIGACGIVPVCANYEPKTYIKAFQAAQQNDIPTLNEMNKRIIYLRDKLVCSGPFWLSGIKYAVSKLGLASERVLSPLSPVGLQQKETIDHIEN